MGWEVGGGGWGCGDQSHAGGTNKMTARSSLSDSLLNDVTPGLRLKLEADEFLSVLNRNTNVVLHDVIMYCGVRRYTRGGQTF